jgi:hypothetical protein
MSKRVIILIAIGFIAIIAAILVHKYENSVIIDEIDTAGDLIKKDKKPKKTDLESTFVNPVKITPDVKTSTDEQPI